MLPILSVPTPRDVYENRGKLLLGTALLLLALVSHQDGTIRSLRATLEARPAIQERVVTRTIQGPTLVKWRTVTKPGGEKVVEKVRYVESRARSNETEHEETPVCEAQRPVKRGYVGFAAGPFMMRATRARAGLTFFDRLDLGGAYDPRFTPSSGAFQIETAFRF